MFNMKMVTSTLKPTRTIVNSRYLPRSGNANDVDGIISDINRKNMVCDSRILMHNAIFSPESAGK